MDSTLGVLHVLFYTPRVGLEEAKVHGRLLKVFGTFMEIFYLHFILFVYTKILLKV